MIVLLDHHGNEVLSMEMSPPPTIFNDGVFYDFEATQGDEHIYRERYDGPVHTHE